MVASKSVRRPRSFRLLVALALVGAALGQGPTEGLAQSTADDFDAARQRLDELQDQANDLAARYAEAYGRSSALEQQILEIDSRIEGLVRDQRARRKIVGVRVVDVYVYGANADASSLFFDGDSAMDSARRALFAKLISDRDRNALDDLRVLGQDVAAVRDELRIAKGEQDTLAAQLERESAELDEKLQDAQRIRDDLGDQLIAEEAAERRAAQARARAESAARARAAAQETQTSTTASDDHSDPDVSPAAPDEPAVGGGSYGVEICPIRGAVAFSDTWGDARPGGRSHRGVDLLSPSGTPNVAVTSGRIEEDYGDRMGNAIFLYGNNGNTYYYFHLFAFEGDPRDVAQGEVIGYVGSTGASGANHTHFEIHPGGGGAINPYNAARAVC